MLTQQGRKAEATQLLQAYAFAPGSGAEAVSLAQAFFELGRPDDSRQLLKRYAPEFNHSVSVWVSYANLLINQKLWEELRALALQIRQENNVLRVELSGYSYYLEGRAEHERERRSNAEHAFRKMLEHRFVNGALAMITAENLIKLGYASFSQDLL